ncbi:hypothetical protein [Burkholderia stagnalis]|uniref:hypothetical protein n=1 Tax=Burkholderia stagnalis TaxID=1503054 RepID=UPI000F5BA3EE|nr:hypothetical protein [Burkholderia stagnalis]
MNTYKFSAILFAMTAATGLVQAEEIPLFAHFKGESLDSSPVEGYVMFGTFSDGQPTIRATSVTTAVFFEREEYLKSQGGFVRNVLDCRKATIKVDAFGDIDTLRTDSRSLPVESHSIKKMHPMNLPVLARVCKAAGLHPTW